MKKKKVALMRNFDLWSDNFIKIDKEGEHYYFEIGNHNNRFSRSSCDYNEI